MRLLSASEERRVLHAVRRVQVEDPRVLALNERLVQRRLRARRRARLQERVLLLALLCPKSLVRVEYAASLVVLNAREQRLQPLARDLVRLVLDVLVFLVFAYESRVSEVVRVSASAAAAKRGLAHAHLLR